MIASALSVRIAASLLLLGAVATMAAAQEPGRFWFNRSCAHWGQVDEDMVDYLLDVRPQVAICGYFGPNLWAAVSYARQKGEPALWPSLGGGPVDRDWWRDIIEKVHQKDIKMLGMFSMGLTYGDHEKPAGFFRFYDREWDEDVLGPRPKADALSMMQKNADGTPLTERLYQVEGGAEYYFCPNNPNWRAAAKAMVTAALDQGLDQMGQQGAEIMSQLFEALRVTLASAIGDVFTVGLVVVAVGFVATIFLKEIPLHRSRSY